MKSCEKPEVTLCDVESQTSVVCGGKIETYVIFCSKSYYVSAFEEMAEKICDDTLIKMLHEHNPECIAEGYR